jgi:hypothetical protein
VTSATKLERAFKALDGRNPEIAELNEKVLVWYDRAALTDGRFDRVYPGGLSRLFQLAPAIRTLAPDTAHALADPARFKQALSVFWGEHTFLDFPGVQVLQVALMGKADHQRHTDRFSSYSSALREFLTAVDHAAVSGVMHEDLQKIAKSSTQQHIQMVADICGHRPQLWTMTTSLMNTLTRDRLAAASNLLNIARACSEFGRIYERDTGPTTGGFTLRVARALETSCVNFEASLRSFTERSESLLHDAGAYDRVPRDLPRDFDRYPEPQGSPYAVNYFTPDPANAREIRVLGGIKSLILLSAMHQELTLTALRLGVVNSDRAHAIEEGLRANRRALLAFSVASTTQQAIEAISTTKFSAVPPALRVAEIVGQIRLLATQWIGEHQSS